jgi:WD40 repeat protein
MRLPNVRLRLYPRLIWTVALVLATCSIAAARQADKGKAGAAQAIRTDLYGDPLPPAAIARLGTIRDFIGEPSGEIVLSPDGKTITATTQGWWLIPLQLWDVETGRVLAHLKELEPPPAYATVLRIAFSPDGKLLAAGDSVGTVRIGTMTTGRKIGEIVGTEGVSSLAFLPDGKRLAVAYSNGEIWLYWIATGERIRSLAMAPYFGLYMNVFSPDGKVMSVRSNNGLSIRDVLTGQERSRLFQQPVRSRRRAPVERSPAGARFADGMLRAFSPDDKLLAVGTRNPRVWDVAAQRANRFFPQPRLPHRSAALVDAIEIDDSWEPHLVFSTDGKLLAAEETHEGTCLWSVTTGKIYRRFPKLEIGHGIAFSSDGKRLISGGRHFRYWDIARGREVRRSPRQDEVRAIAFGPGGKTLVTADGTIVRFWDAATGRELHQFQGHHAQVHEVEIAPNGKIVASSDSDATLILWDVSTGRQVRTFADRAPVKGNGQAPDERTDRSIAFSPAGKTYAVSEKQGTRLYNLDTGAEIRRLPGSDRALSSLSFAPDGQTLAAITGTSVLFWDVATGRERPALDHSQSVTSIAFAPDGKTLAIGDQIGDIRLWDVETGQSLNQFGEKRRQDGAPCAITCVAFLSNDKTLAAAEDDGVVQLWDTGTGKVLRHLEGHVSFVYRFAVAPDGKTLATASADGTTLVWDVTEIAH